MKPPLEGIRVLDLSRVLAGPFATQLLGDLGAEIIKVEAPGRGDETRSWGPPFAAGEAAYYLSVNRNKKSITVNLKTLEGIDIIKKLAKISDVFIENFKVGGLDKLGLGYEEIKKENPRIIYVSITGFGHTGPYRERPGYDFIIQGMCGVMSVTGEPGSEPMKVGVAWTDVITGLFASNAILAALIEREKSGLGQYIDISLLDSAIAAMVNQASNYLISGVPPKRYGNAHPNIVPYQAFKTKDSYIILAVGNDSQFRKFCSVAGREDLADHPDFSTNPKRVENRERLIPIIKEIMLTKTTAEWCELLTKAKIPCGPIYNLKEVFEDPHVLSRQMVVKIKHPTARKIPLVGTPLKFSRTKIQFKQHPPLLGEHTDEVLHRLLGFSKKTLKVYHKKGII